MTLKLDNLKVNDIVQTKICNDWMSQQFWSITQFCWIEIPVGTVGIVVNVNQQKVELLMNSHVYSIHNCYDDTNGSTVWCDKL